MVKNNSNDIPEDSILKEETQPGVTVYRDIASAPLHAGVIDMDVADGVDELTLKYDLCMAESKKSFPDVKRLIIDEMVFRIEMPNTLFPNVRYVLSYSHMFDSGEYLIGRTYGFTDVYKRQVLHIASADFLVLAGSLPFCIVSGRQDAEFFGSLSVLLAGYMLVVLSYM